MIRFTLRQTVEETCADESASDMPNAKLLASLIFVMIYSHLTEYGSAWTKAGRSPCARNCIPYHLTVETTTSSDSLLTVKIPILTEFYLG